MRGVVVLLTLVAAVAALPKGGRIVGGSKTTINQYPEMVALLFSGGPIGHIQECGGSIINNRSVLTAAHCIFYEVPPRVRNRIGSTYANSGGVVHNSGRFVIHPEYTGYTMDHDIAVIHVTFPFNLNNVARAGRVAGPNYNLADNQVVWAAGWGIYESPPVGERGSEVLRHVQKWTINFNICRQRFNEIGMDLTTNMLCSGWLDVGGRDQCYGDSGSPLFHNGVIVGVCSFGPPGSCGHPRIPGVNIIVSRYANWINANR